MYFLAKGIYDNICEMVGNLTGYIITQDVLTGYSNLLVSVVRNAEYIFELSLYFLAAAIFLRYTTRPLRR